MSDYEAENFKVVFISDGYPTDYHRMNGIFLHRAVKALSQSIRVSVIHLRAWKPNRPVTESRLWDGIQVLSLSIPQIPVRSWLHFNTKLIAILGLPYARKTLQDADVLHSTGIYPPGYITSAWSQYTEKPHVTHAVGDDVNIILPNAKWFRDEKNWLANIDGVACVSQNIKSRLYVLANGLPNVRVIYRGVDTSEFIAKDLPKLTQAKLAPIRFLYMGGFQTWDKQKLHVYNVKGGHVLLDAWRKVEMLLGESSLVISGPGTDLRHLKSWQESLQRPDAVTFLPTIAPQSVPNLIRKSNVVIIPSLSEGLPNLAYESHACGCAILGSDAGGIPEVVIHGETGRIVPKGDPIALGEGMRWFFSHQSEINKMGSKARQHILQNFTFDSSTKEMISLFKIAIVRHKSLNQGVILQAGE
jgi:teichuronic acid biosynthesis glycosyltransferase TuaC